MSNLKKTALPEIPIEQLKALVGHYETVSVRLARRNERGQLQTLGRYVMDPLKVCEADTWASQEADGDGFGGGTFCFDVYDTVSQAALVPRFEVQVAGPPTFKTKAPQGQSFGDALPSGGVMSQGFGFPGQYPMPPQAQLPVSVARQMPPWVQGLPVQQQIDYAQMVGLMQGPVTPPTGRYAAPVAQFTSDVVLREQVEESRSQLAAMQKQLEDLNKQREREAQQAREREAHLREERREAERRADAERVEQRFREMTEMIRQGQSAKPVLSPEAIGSIVTGAAGIFTSLMTANRDRDAIQAERQNKSQELQMNGIQTLMHATLAKGGGNQGLVDMMKIVIPAISPLALAWWESRSPRAQADLVATMAENNITTISLMAQLIQQFSEGQGDQPYWLPMVQEVINGVVDTAKQVAARSKEAGGAQPPVASMHAPAAPSHLQVSPELAQALEGKQGTYGYQVTAQIFGHAQFPVSFKTPPWAQILCAAHNQENVELVADFMAEHLLALGDEIPREIQMLWTFPERTLQAIFSTLPIAQANPDYTKRLIQTVVQKLADAEEDEGGDEGDDSGGEPVVTPSPKPSKSPAVDYAPTGKQTVNA